MASQMFVCVCVLKTMHFLSRMINKLTISLHIKSCSHCVLTAKPVRKLNYLII